MVWQVDACKIWLLFWFISGSVWLKACWQLPVPPSLGLCVPLRLGTSCCSLLRCYCCQLFIALLEDWLVVELVNPLCAPVCQLGFWVIVLNISVTY